MFFVDEFDGDYRSGGVVRDSSSYAARYCEQCTSSFGKIDCNRLTMRMRPDQWSGRLFERANHLAAGPLETALVRKDKTRERNSYVRQHYHGNVISSIKVWMVL